MILYLNFYGTVWQHKLKLAGIERFAATREWRVVTVPPEKSKPEDLAAVLSRLRPDGCIVELSIPNPGGDLLPRLFGTTPVVFLDPHRRGWHGAPCVTCDNAAVAKVAFDALAAGLPPAYAVVPYRWRRHWNDERVTTFRALCRRAGAACTLFPAKEDEEIEDRLERMTRWAATLPPHVAVFAANDRTAGEVARALRAVSRPFPRTATLLGVDGTTTIAGEDGPRISSVRLDFERMGFVAARALGEKMAGVSAARGLRADPLTISPLMVDRRESTRGHGRRGRYAMEAVEAIRREACSGVTAAEIAARFPVSRNDFEQRFREAMGHSVLEEIIQVRLEQARALLARRDLRIDAISDFCGFGTDREFRKLFGRRTGMSPREWRKRHYL